MRAELQVKIAFRAASSQRSCMKAAQAVARPSSNRRSRNCRSRAVAESGKSTRSSGMPTCAACHAVPASSARVPAAVDAKYGGE